MQGAAAGYDTPHAGAGQLVGVGAVAAVLRAVSAADIAVQTEEDWPSGPAWGVADYEEEVRQLSEQLQVR